MPTYSNKEYIKIMRRLPDYVEHDSYGIPVIAADSIDISAMNNGLWLINMKNVSSKDRFPERKIVHSFCYDKTLYRAYNDPITYLARVGPYYAVSSLDFSMDSKMDFKQILEATYNNRWSGSFMQTHGKLVIPTVGWVNPDSYDICFSGLRDGGVFLISTLGVKNPSCHQDFIEGYHEMRERFPNTKIISVGQRVDGMDNDVCYVKYEESFGNWDRHKDCWQPRLFNWDMSIPKGV